MNNELLNALGELQDRLKKLEAATLMLSEAKRQAEACATAARETTQAASAVVIRTQELREVTMAVAALPEMIVAIKETIAAVSDQLRLELKSSVIDIHGRQAAQIDRLLHTLTDQVIPEILQGIDRAETKLSAQTDQTRVALLHTLTDQVIPEILQGIDRSETKLSTQADQNYVSLLQSQRAILADMGIKFNQMQNRLTIAVCVSGLAVVIAVGVLAKLFFG